MTLERKTRRISISISITKGKNARMALAATEKAKVCTSVRIRYFTVESTSPERRGTERGESAVVFGGIGMAADDMGGFDISQRCQVLRDAASWFFANKGTSPGRSDVTSYVASTGGRGPRRNLRSCVVAKAGSS